MARFAAFTSDSSSDEEIEEIIPEKPAPKTPPVVRTPNKSTPRRGVRLPSESEDDEEEESSSDLDLEDLASPQRKSGNALVENDNGDIQYAHEMRRGGGGGAGGGGPVASASTAAAAPPRSRKALNLVGDPTIIPWAQRVGVDAQKMHVMQASLFRMPEEAAALRELKETTTRPPAVKLDVGKHPGLTRKHRRDSDGDGARFDSRERISFGQDVPPIAYRPTRKYARVGITSSIANENEGAYVDAGLAMGRSFRVGWGPGGKLVHLGSICGPMTTTCVRIRPLTTAALQPSSSSRTASANSSTVHITQIQPSLTASRSDANPAAANGLKPSQLANKLLQHHLSHTAIVRDEHGIPSVYPASRIASLPPKPAGSTLWTYMPAAQAEPLEFSSFAALFDSNDTSFPAPIFRLGHALFDPLDLHLDRTKRGPEGSNITPDIRNRVSILRRKTELSRWLESVVKPNVEADLRVQANGSNGKYTAADAAFTLLTGHQVETACATAADGGYLKLATLISQAGGDDTFKDDILSQLDVWKDEKLSPGSNTLVGGNGTGLVGRGVWRIYNVLSGLVHEQEESDKTREESVFVGLDWKRIFGMCLWYGTSIDASVLDVVAAYERILLHNSRGPAGDIGRPVPKWAVATKPATAPSSSALGASAFGFSSAAAAAAGVRPVKDAGSPEDPLYVLIKLYANPALSLSSALTPLSFSPAPLDVGIAMCWHLYIILSRVMKIRDFADRTDSHVQSGRSFADAVRNQPRTSMVNGTGTGAGTGAGAGRRGRGSLPSPALTEDETDDAAEEGIVQRDGHSPTADLLTSTYAFELESWGMVQEAAFVLMHIEDNVGREKALKDLLNRNASQMSEWTTRGLVGSLKLPPNWINEARATYELDQGNVFAAYELYITAEEYNTAHDLAVLELAPDAIIRKDHELLKRLFSVFDAEKKRDKIKSWFVKGKVLLDYVETVARLPQLLESVRGEGDAVPDAAQAEEIERLSRQIPKIIAILPDIFQRSRTTDDRHVAAVEEMTKDLLRLMENAQPLLLKQIKKPTLTAVDSSARINMARGIGYARFLQTIEA